MNYYRPPYTFLVVFADPADAAKIDQAIAAQKLGCDKLGERTYLGFFFEQPSEMYATLKRDFGIQGKADWMQLQHSERTE